MADKKKLTGSFGTNRQRTKPSLDEIEKIVAGTDPAPPPAFSAPAAAPDKGATPDEKPRKAATTTPAKPAQKRAKVAIPPAEPTAIPMKKTSVDLPLALYQDIKIHLIKRQVKFREYLTDLIEADLKKHR
jgi:hypothetical protein